MSLACSISPDIFIHAKHSEEPLVNKPCRSFPCKDLATVTLPTAKPPGCLLRLLLPFHRQATYCACIHSAGARRASRLHRLSLAILLSFANPLRRNCFVFANPLDEPDTLARSSGYHPRGQPLIRHQPGTLTISSRLHYFRAKNSGKRSLSCSSFETAQILAAKLASAPRQGFPKDPRRSHR